MEQLAALAVCAANDLEAALMLGETDKAQALKRLIQEKLGDTRGQVERRAERGGADALFALGIVRARNLLGAGNGLSACSLFIQAAGKEHVAGTYEAELCVLQRDPEQSAAWMRLAADAGHPAAQEAVGRACLDRRPFLAPTRMRRALRERGGASRTS